MKRSPGLRDLSSEHHSGLVLARRIAQTVVRDNVDDVWQDVVQRFEAEIEPHFRREELLLLPALESAGENALVERTLAEHKQLRALVYEKERDADSLHLFAHLLHTHIRFEERELFVTAQLRLPEFTLPITY